VHHSEVTYIVSSGALKLYSLTHPCTTQLLEVADKLSEMLDYGGSIDMVYLDFSKAFDTVRHYRLLMKLESYGVTGRVLQWIRSF